MAAIALGGGLPARAAPDALVDVAGSVVATAPRLELLITLTNRGDRATGPIELAGELEGERTDARLASGLAPGAAGSVPLSFGSPPSRPGLHAVTLLIEHPGEGATDAAANPPLVSQRAWLSVAFGSHPGEAVRLDAAPIRLDVSGTLVVGLESRDGSELRVNVRALTPRGLRPEGVPVPVVVPARGRVTAELRLARAGAPRGSRHAVLVVAEAPDGPLARTSVAAAMVDVAPEVSWVRRFRTQLVTVGSALLGGALVFELYGRRRRASSA